MTIATATAEEQMRIERAVGAVGFNIPGNDSLKFDTFEPSHIKPLTCFLPETGELIEVLRSAPVSEARSTYLANDRPSNEAQSSYKRRRLGVGLILALAAVIAIIIAFRLPEFLARQYLWALETSRLISLDDQQRVDEVQRLAATIESYAPFAILIIFVMTPLAAHFLRPNLFYESWKKSRAKAEAFRVEYFKRVFAAEPRMPLAGSLPLLPLKLEYFRRWQIEVQKAYFSKKHAMHLNKTRRAVRTRHWVMAGLALWVGVLLIGWVGSLDEQGPLPLIGSESRSAAWLMSKLQLSERYEIDQKFLILGLLMVLVWIFVDYLAYLSASARNAARFKVMEQNFSEIEQLMPAARLAAARGETATVLQFVDRVHSTMSIELAEWVRLADLDQGKYEGSFLPIPASGTAQATSS